MSDASKQVRDGWENTITGLGRARDKRMGTSIKFASVEGSRDRFDAYYHGDDTSATIAALPAKEMTRRWLTLSVDDTGSDVKTEQDAGDKMLTAKTVMQALDDLKAKSLVMEALLWARVHGGSLLFLGVDDGVEDLREPLNLDNVKTFDFMTVFDRWDVQILEVVNDMRSPDFGMPNVYLLQPQVHSVGAISESMSVHASRFIRFDGTVTSRHRMALNGGWADSVYTRMLETLQDYGISWAGVAHLLQDFSQAVLKMRGLADAICQQESNVVLDRMNAMDQCRSVARAIPIDAEDEDFMRAQTPMSGLPETIDRLMLRVASAARMPATLLFGQSPSGLNATGESDIRLFYDQIEAEQENILRPRIDRILDILFAAREGPTRGKAPENWSYRFNPLWQPTDKERADVRKVTAETDAIYIADGVLDSDEVAVSRFGGDTYSTETVLDTEARAAMPPEETEPTEPGEPAAAAGVEPAPDAAAAPAETLNGAQIQALVDIIKAVQLGEIPKGAAMQVVLAAFPLDIRRVQQMFVSVEEGKAARVVAPTPPANQFIGGRS